MFLTVVHIIIYKAGLPIGVMLMVNTQNIVLILYYAT